MSEELVGIAWQTSSRSQGGGGNCVEVGPVQDGSGRIAVRHSKRPEGAVIVYSREEWDAFVGGAKAGEFDF